MQHDQEELVRRVLEQVLDRLNDQAGRNDAPRGETLSSRSASQSNEPVVLVVLGGLDARSSSSEAPSQRAPSVSTAGSAAPNPQATKLSHPGHERFTIAGPTSTPGAPKTCFMEPARLCVNSGACEMRGY